MGEKCPECRMIGSHKLQCSRREGKLQPFFLAVREGEGFKIKEGPMPSHFDRFRLLNDGVDLKFRNESDKVVYLSADENGERMFVGPGEQELIPVSPAGETIIEVESSEGS